MACRDDIVVIDDDSEAAGSAPSSTGVGFTRPSSTPNSGPSCGRSPLQHLEEVSRGRDASAARQLYQDGFYVDDRALTERLRHLEATGKAPVRQEPVKHEEDLQRRPTADDIAALQLQLEEEPSLLQQLSRGEGSSSNPRHLWRLCVYQAWEEQQKQLYSHAQQRVYGLAGIEQEIPDSEDPDSEDEAPLPAKKRRATGPPAAAAAAAGNAGSSKAAAAAAGGVGSSRAAAAGGAGSNKAPAAGGACSNKAPAAKRQRRAPDGPASSGPSSSQPGGSDQPQQPRRPPAAPKPPHHNQRHNPRMPAGRNNAAAAAAGDGGGSGGDSFTEREEQRRLRGQLAQMEALVEARHAELTDSKSGKLLGYLKKLGELGEQANKRPREAAQHAGVLAKCIKSGVEMFHSYSNTSKGRSAAQLTAAVRSMFALDHAAALARDGPVAVNWEALGRASSHLFRIAPGLSSMLGALESQAKVRKQVMRQKRAALEPEVRPKDGPDALRQEHGLGQETERVVTHMRRVLERVGSCSLIALVLDHDSFAHTLENVFALSFLCKDMYVGLEEDKAAGLIVRHITKERQVQLQREHDAAAAGARGGRLNPHQFMMELDVACWKDMKAVVPRADMLMPQRPRTQH